MTETKPFGNYIREAQLKRMEETPFWDLLIIGGGATGLGIALDAVGRGYKTLLVEQSDFAKGTSSRSTKLVHGGVRYLAQGRLRLVREASVERGLLLKNAPHLVKNLTFLIPLYNFPDIIKYTLGLKIYDWIAGRLSFGSSLFLSRKKTIDALPGIRTNGLKGSVAYHDGQFDDARLAINLVQTLIDKGATAINYMKMTGLLKNGEGMISGIAARDEETGHSYRIHARAVVNATGIFADDILKMDVAGLPDTIVLSQGVHLVLDKSFFPSPHALMIPETPDGRLLFAVPWHDKVIVGTTDTPVNKVSLEPAALEKEIDFIIETASAYFIRKPSKKDVLSVFAGLRPLAAPGTVRKKTKDISRRHTIMVSASGLFTMAGGKWTTFRKMGEDMVDTIEKQLHWKHRRSTSRNQHIHGYLYGNDHDHLDIYGSDAALIRLHKNFHEDDWISEQPKVHRMQVIWAVENEMARTVEDVLARRTGILFRDARAAIRICEKVASIMAGLRGKDSSWIQQQVREFTGLAGRYIVGNEKMIH